jgi:2-phosphosulfolactate phosphatase
MAPTVRADAWLGVADLTPTDVAGRVVAVVDVLRASTTIAAALAHGARAVIPCASTEDASLRAKTLSRADILLAGEQRMRPIPGFDLGNSPADYTAETVAGKTIVFTTTNGTPALLGVHSAGAADVVVAAYANFSAILVLLRAALRGGTDIGILCAGHNGRFALEDAACAGSFLRELAEGVPDVLHNDAALACLAVERRYAAAGAATPTAIEASEHGRALAQEGFTGDLAVCATRDIFPVVPIYQDRQITKLGPDRSR